jgi:hypothetical protein
MKFLIYIFIGFGLCVTGCKTMQPVSSIQEIKKDSTTTFTQTKKDSSFSFESTTLTPSNSTFDFALGNGLRIDSIIVGLKGLPKSVPKVIQVSSGVNTNQVVLFLLDSMGKLHVHLNTLTEKMIHKEHYISTLTNQLTKKNEENFSLKKESTEEHKTIWEKLKDSYHQWYVKFWIWLVLVCLGVAMVEYGLTYFKKINWLGKVGGVVIKLFTKNRTL